jgi:very-short-patch-repair endonuclease
MRADIVIAEMAAEQHGVIARSQLLAAGQRANAIQRRVRSGQLRPLQRGVYQVGPVPAPLGRIMAAVLASSGGLGGRGGRGAARAGAVVSHHTAAGLRTLQSPKAATEPVDVLVPRVASGRRPGVRAHRVDRLEIDEVGLVEGIPVTTAARTLLDLAAAVPTRELERMVAYAERESLASPGDVGSLVERHAHHRGTAALRRVLGARGGPQLTRSEAESQLLALVRRANLTPPALNARVAGYEVDFLWRAERLVVEVDGFAFHSSASAFERDRRRDAALTAAGFRVLRVTWRQIVKEPESLIATLVRALFR